MCPLMAAVLLRNPVNVLFLTFSCLENPYYRELKFLSTISMLFRNISVVTVSYP